MMSSYVGSRPSRPYRSENWTMARVNAMAAAAQATRRQRRPAGPARTTALRAAGRAGPGRPPRDSGGASAAAGRSSGTMVVPFTILPRRILRLLQGRREPPVAARLLAGLAAGRLRPGGPGAAAGGRRAGGGGARAGLAAVAL